MAFPTGWNKKHKIVIDADYVSDLDSADISPFRALFTEDNFLSEIFTYAQGREVYTNYLYDKASVEGYWRLESDGTDSSANGNTLTASGSPSFVTGKFGNAVDLELSSSQYFYLADASQTGLDFTGDFSISAWIKLEQLPSTAGSNFTIVSKDNADGGANRSYSFNILSSGDTLRVYFRDSSDNQTFWTCQTAFTAADVGRWIHVMALVDVSAPNIDFYIDGVLQGATANASAATNVKGTNANIGVGCRQNGASYQEYLDGIIDDLCIWSELLDNNDVQAIWLGGADIRFSTDLAGTTQIAHEIVRFDENDESVEIYVRIPTVDYNDDTAVYVWYNNTSVELQLPSDTYGSQAVWDTSVYGAVHHWNRNLLDSTSNGNDGSSFGAGLSWEDSKLGFGIAFDGDTDSYYLISDAASLDTSLHKFVLQIWANPSASISGTDHFINADSGSAGRRALLPNDSTGWAVQFRNDGGNAYSVAEGSALSTGAWHLIHGVYDAAELIIYEDGAEVTATAYSSYTVGDIGGNVYIGRHPTITTSAYIGSADEFRWLINSLTPGYIQTEFNNMNSPSTFAAAVSLTIEEVYTETITIVDSIVKAPGKVLSDALDIVDSIARVFTGSRVYTETVSLVDSFTRALTANRAFTETITLVQSFLAAFGRVLNETISITDTFLSSASLKRVLEETVTVVDRIIKSISRTLTDAIDIVDSKVKSLSRSLLESVVIQDTVTKVRNLFRTLTETVVVTDTVEKVRTLLRTLTETITLTDLITNIKTIRDKLLKVLRVRDSKTGDITVTDNFKLSVEDKDSKLKLKE